jgi:hypothetical protein
MLAVMLDDSLRSYFAFKFNESKNGCVARVAAETNLL